MVDDWIASLLLGLGLGRQLRKKERELAGFIGLDWQNRYNYLSNWDERARLRGGRRGFMAVAESFDRARAAGSSNLLSPLCQSKMLTWTETIMVMESINHG